MLPALAREWGEPEERWTPAHVEEYIRFIELVEDAKAAFLRLAEQSR